jgi:hypothetical protein
MGGFLCFAAFLGLCFAAVHLWNRSKTRDAELERLAKLAVASAAVRTHVPSRRQPRLPVQNSATTDECWVLPGQPRTLGCQGPADLIGSQVGRFDPLSGGFKIR